MFYRHLSTRDTNIDLKVSQGEAAINVTLIVIYWYFMLLLPRQVKEKEMSVWFQKWRENDAS